MLLIFAFGFIAALLYFLPGNTSLPPDRAALALKGVTSNAEWQALSRRINGVNMQLVPAGCFTMGTPVEQLDEGLNSCKRFYGSAGCLYDFTIEQPAHEVCISQPYWIDQVAVTNLQYLLLSHSNPDSPYNDLALPVQGITWQEASDYCQLRGGRLPTEAEWEFAARGPDNLIYPFGNQYDVELVTTRKIDPPQGGQRPGGASWLGAQDMSGGMGEWVSDWFGPYARSSQLDPQGPENGELRIVRGGTWFAHAAFFVRSAFREVHEADYATSVIGMRCVLEIKQE